MKMGFFWANQAFLGPDPLNYLFQEGSVRTEICICLEGIVWQIQLNSIVTPEPSQYLKERLVLPLGKVYEMHCVY